MSDIETPTVLDIETPTVLDAKTPNSAFEITPDMSAFIIRIKANNIKIFKYFVNDYVLSHKGESIKVNSIQIHTACKMGFVLCKLTMIVRDACKVPVDNFTLSTVDEFVSTKASHMDKALYNYVKISTVSGGYNDEKCCAVDSNEHYDISEAVSMFIGQVDDNVIDVLEKIVSLYLSFIKFYAWHVSHIHMSTPKRVSASTCGQILRIMGGIGGDIDMINAISSVTEKLKGRR